MVHSVENLYPDEDDALDFKSHFLDSGAFSLATQAKKFAQENNCSRFDYYVEKKDGRSRFSQSFREYMDKYVAFVKQYAIGIDHYANCDVIYNPELSYRSQKYLEKQGIKPVPIVHIGADTKWIRRYIEEGYDFIGVGASGRDTTITLLFDWLSRCFDVVCDTPDRMPKVKIHGFGATSYRLLQTFPFYSVDSTAWKKRAAYGKLFIPVWRHGEFRFDLHWYDIFVSNESERVRIAGQHIGEEVSRKRSGPFWEGKPGKNHAVISSLKRESLMHWVEHLKIPKGESKLVVNDKGEKEYEIITEGYSNSAQIRSYANLRFFEEVAKSLPTWPFPFGKPSFSLKVFK